MKLNRKYEYVHIEILMCYYMFKGSICFSMNSRPDMQAIYVPCLCFHIFHVIHFHALCMLQVDTFFYFHVRKPTDMENDWKIDWFYHSFINSSATYCTWKWRLRPMLMYKFADDVCYEVSWKLVNEKLIIKFEGDFAEAWDEEFFLENVRDLLELEAAFWLPSWQPIDKKCEKVRSGMVMCASHTGMDMRTFDAKDEKAGVLCLSFILFLRFYI